MIIVGTCKVRALEDAAKVFAGFKLLSPWRSRRVDAKAIQETRHKWPLLRNFLRTLGLFPTAVFSLQWAISISIIRRNWGLNFKIAKDPGDQGMDIILDIIEVRVLGCLMEKELATPEYYPLSLNALINACNQKSNRFPVLSLDENKVAGALQSLREKHLAYQSDASRVPKYWHDIVKQNNLIRREAALLCLLLLRGPQTAGELRSRTERLCSFENLEEVLQYLDNLSGIGFVAKLARQPGQKEQRFAHLLAGEPDTCAQDVSHREPIMIAGEADNDRIDELEKTVAYLKEEIERLKNEFIFFKKEFE